jgi:iron(III) transport system permease protein
MGRSLRQVLRRYEQHLFLAAAGSMVLLFCAAPIVQLFEEALTAGASALDVWAHPRPWLLLGRSILLAGVVTACALVLGTIVGLLVARTDLPARRTLWLLHAFPFFLPPFLLALGWFQLFGQTALLGTPATSRLLFSDLGLIAILTLSLSPIASALVILALLGVDASLEEAARIAARPWHVITRILLPSARPALVLAAVVMFTLAVSELGVPMFLRVDVFPAAIFARLGGMSYAPGEAFVLALPLIPMTFALLAIERRYAGARAFAVAGLRGMSRRPLPLGSGRLACTGVAWGIAVVGALPIVALALRAASGGSMHDLQQWLGRAPWTSLSTALIAAAVISSVSIVLGHALARGVRVAAPFDAIAMLAFLTPASVLGIGLIAVWMNPATSTLYGSVAILVIGYVARYAAVGIRAASAVMLQSPVHMEEAAATVGAGYWRRLTRIVLPANVKGVVAATLLATVFCLRDFETALLYYPPGREPLPVRIFTLEANGPPAVITALAVAQVLLTAAVFAVGVRLIARGSAR